MALKTPSIDSLLEKNAQSLEKAGYDPSVSLEQFRRRKTIQKLLDRKEELTGLRSTDHQRMEYGAESWDAQFIKLSDIPEHPRLFNSAEELHQRIWNAIPRSSRFRRFQELFCDPRDVIVPRYTLDENGWVSFGNIDFNEMTLAGCLVSADRIPDAFAEGLHLADYTDTQGRPLERLRRKRAAIPRLKRLWEATIPLHEGHYRLLAVGHDLPELDAHYADVPGPDPQTVGSLLYLRGENMQDGFIQERVVSLFDSTVYGAYRKTVREFNAYTEESRSIRDFKRRLDIAKTRLAAPQGDTPENRQSAQNIMAETVAAFESCDNRYKKEAHAMLRQAMTFKDSRDRDNPTIALRRMIAATDRIQKRFNEMRGKSGYNTQDQMTLDDLIDSGEKSLRDYRTTVEHAAAVIPRMTFLWSGVQLSPQQIEGRLKGINNLIHSEHLSNLKVQPFTVYAEALLQQERALEHAIRMRNLHEAKTALVTSHLIGKYQEVQAVLEEIRRQVIDPESAHISLLIGLVRKLRTVFNTFQVFPEHIVESFVAEFENMKNGLTVLEQGLAMYDSRQLDIDKTSEMYRNMVKYIDQFDAAGIVRGVMEHHVTPVGRPPAGQTV